MRSGVGFVRWRSVAVAVAAAGLVAVGLGSTAGMAHAVDPDRLREGCVWRNDVDEANHVQTCTFYSQSLGRQVAVQVRASDNAAGTTEQGIYFLDGLGSNPEYSTWSTADAGALTNYSSSYNLVMPAGGAGEWMTNWEAAPTGEDAAPQWDTFLGEELPAYLAKNFDVGSSNNAMVGVSMSAAPAVIVALNHPEVFSVVRSYSGYYQTDSVLGYALIPLIQSARADITNGISAMWGLPHSEGNQWSANDVMVRLAEAKVNGQTVVISTGNGMMTQAEFDAAWSVIQEQFEADPATAISLLPAAAQGIVLGTALEVGALVSTGALNVAAEALDLPVEFKYGNGSHNWIAWSANESDDAAEIEEALAAAAAKSAAASNGSSTTTTTSSAAVTAVAEKTLTAVAEKTVTAVAETAAAPDNADSPVPASSEAQDSGSAGSGLAQTPETAQTPEVTASKESPVTESPVTESAAAESAAVETAATEASSGASESTAPAEAETPAATGTTSEAPDTTPAV